MRKQLLILVSSLAFYTCWMMFGMHINPRSVLGHWVFFAGVLLFWPQVEELGEATKEIVRLMGDFECYNRSLQVVKDGYNIGDEVRPLILLNYWCLLNMFWFKFSCFVLLKKLTDFESLLSEQADQCKEQSPLPPPEQHILYKQFRETIWVW